MHDEPTVPAPPTSDGGTPSPLASSSSEPARATITRVLAQARTRLLRRGRLERTARGVTLVTGTAIALATIRALAPAFDLRAATSFTLLTALVGLYLASRARRRALDEHAVAEALHHEERERGVLPIADELRSLLELEASRRAGRLSDGAAFLSLLEGRVERALASSDLAVVVPLRDARRRLLRGALVSALGIAAVALVQPHLWPEAWAALRHGAPTDAVPPPPPIVGDLELELRPPAYTGLPPRTLPSSSGELRVLRGTSVHLRARSLGRTVRAALILEQNGQKPKRLPVTVSSGTAANPLLEADFDVDAPGGYRFVLWRWTGRVVEPEAHRIDLEPDLPPRVELRVPADPLELPVPRPVELGIDAEDDFGLGAVSLVYEVQADGRTRKPKRVPLTLEQPTPRRAQGRYTWETGELEREGPLPPGAKISYWIEAEDNDAASGKKIGRSRTATITLRTPDKPQNVDRATLEGLLEPTITHLADRLEKKTSPEPHAALVQLVATWKKADAATATPQLKKLAQKLAGELDKLATDEARGAKIHDALVPALERAILALDDLRGRRRLEDMARIGKEMTRVRDELQRLMTELKSATSDQQKELLKKEIERKLVELEAKMAELRQAQQDAESEVPDEFLNRDAFKKAQKVANATSSIRELLQKGELDKAMSELSRMSRALDDMNKQIGDSRDQQRAAADPEAERAMAALENDLADLAKDQHAVEEESRALHEQLAQDKSGSSSLKALRDKLRPKLQELDRRAEEQSRDGRMIDPEDVQRLRGRARNVDRALEAEDLDEAREMASQARRLAQGTSTQLHEIVQEQEAEQQARVGDGPSPALRRADRHAQEIEQLAQQIEQELSRSDADRPPPMSADQKKRLDELGKRQGQLQQRADELRRRMGQEPGLQGMPQQLGDKIDGARQKQGEAGRQLQRGQPGRGADAAGQAARQLDEAREQASQARRGGGGDGKEDGNSGERDEPVRIPGADDSAAPKAFREELLDAMKRGAPKKFEEQVQRFYEELVR